MFKDPSGVEALSFMVWRDTTASALAATQFETGLPRGDLQHVTLSEGSTRRAAVAVTAYAQWSDPSGAAGSYECRHLFVQIDPTLVADVIACGGRVRDNSAPVSPAPALRDVQERVAIRLAPAGGRP
jgi:hypothetical protein